MQNLRPKLADIKINLEKQKDTIQRSEMNEPVQKLVRMNFPRNRLAVTFIRFRKCNAKIITDEKDIEEKNKEGAKISEMKKKRRKQGKNKKERKFKNYEIKTYFIFGFIYSVFLILYIYRQNIWRRQTRTKKLLSNTDF